MKRRRCRDEDTAGGLIDTHGKLLLGHEVSLKHNWGQTRTALPKLSTIAYGVRPVACCGTKVAPLDGNCGLSLLHRYFTAAVIMTSTFMSGLPRSQAPQARAGGLS